jgi:protein tyrosine phosphatase
MSISLNLSGCCNNENILNEPPAKKLKSSTDSLKSSSESIKSLKTSSDSIHSQEKIESVAVSTLSKITTIYHQEWESIKERIKSYYTTSQKCEENSKEMLFQMEPYEKFQQDIQTLNKFSIPLKDLETQLKSEQDIYGELKEATLNWKNFDHFSASDNPELNRYFDVYPYDWNLIRTNSGINKKSTEQFYLNADIVTANNRQQDYIMTQGPVVDSKCNTLPDFWGAILDNNSHVIVCLTEAEEKNTSKCHPYWNKESVVSFDMENPLTKVCKKVTVVPQDPTEDKANNLTIVNFTIYEREIGGKQESVQSDQPRTVKFFHFRNWPDFGAPTATLFSGFTNKVDEHYQQSSKKGPITVHCSAGIGRAGTFVAFHSLLKQIHTAKKENKDIKNIEINIPKHVSLLRAQRQRLVQTEDQFKLIYQALIEEVKKLSN